MIKKQYFLKFCLFLVLGVIFHLSGEEKNKQDFPSYSININPKKSLTYSGTCEDLRVITSFENFFLQMYHHLDDDCLYTMTNEQFSKKLGVRVLDYYEDLGTVSLLRNNLANSDVKNNIIVFRKDYHNKNFLTLDFREQRKYSWHYAGGRKNIRKMNKYKIKRGEFRVVFTEDYLKQFGYPFLSTFPKGMLAPIQRRSEIVDKSSCSGSNRVQTKYFPYEEVNLWFGDTYSFIYLSNCYSDGKFYFDIEFYKSLFMRKNNE